VLAEHDISPSSLHHTLPRARPCCPLLLLQYGGATKRLYTKPVSMTKGQPVKVRIIIAGAAR
jgi:hypothetical protein